MRVTLFVTKVPSNYTAGDIWECIHLSNWGIVENITLLPKTFYVNGYQVRNVIVHMYDWNDQTSLIQLNQGKYLKLYYDDKYYLKTKLYIQPSYKSHPILRKSKSNIDYTNETVAAAICKELVAARGGGN